MTTTITTLAGEPLGEVDAVLADPDAALYRAIELAGEHGGPVLLDDDEGCYRVYSDGWTEAL